MAIRIHGFAPREGDTAFAFCVLKLAAPVDRARLDELVRGLAPIVSSGEVAELEAGARIVSLPWLPPDGDEVAAQRAALERAGELGVEEIWFAQTGEQPLQARQVRFPVDDYPEILESFDWEDFGIACKLGGPWIPGEATVLASLHAMWLGPYGSQHRNTAVTIDHRHHAVHFWVDRFTAPSEPRELVHHLLWIVSKLDEIFPVLHARFEGATMAQKYGGLVGDTSEPFVLGGNPLRAVHTIGGEAGVDTWIDTQASWSNEEVASMLRELAIDLLAPALQAEDDSDDEGDDEDVELDVDAMFDAAFEGDEDDDEDDSGEDDSGEDDSGEDDSGEDDSGEDDSDEDDSDAAARDTHVPRSARHATLPMIASELLAARAKAGLLDPRVVEALSAIPTRDAADPRLAAANRVLTAVRDHAAPDDHDVN